MQERTTLDEVKRAFEQWRAGKLYQRERAPTYLRDQVKAVAPYYSRRQITEALAINKEQIERYTLCNSPTKLGETLDDVPALNEFVEVPMTKLPETQSKSVPELMLMITRRDGSSWALSEATRDVISESLCLFLRG